jgi:hypothetical protein
MLKELHRSADELSEFLKTLNENDWSHDFGIKSKGLMITVQSTVDDLIEDYAHHTDQIEKWKKAR